MAEKKIQQAKQGMLIRPRVTEKAANLSSQNVYTFDVHTSATKKEIQKAISILYGVNPRKVRMVTVHARSVFVRGKRGKTAGGKKAYVYLAKGETISLA